MNFNLLNEAIADNNLNCSELKVYILMLQLSSLKKSQTFEMYNGFAVDRLNIKERTLQNATKSLTKKGYILKDSTATSKTKKSNIYTIVEDKQGCKSLHPYNNNTDNQGCKSLHPYNIIGCKDLHPSNNTEEKQDKGVNSGNNKGVKSGTRVCTPIDDINYNNKNIKTIDCNVSNIISSNEKNKTDSNDSENEILINQTDMEEKDKETQTTIVGIDSDDVKVLDSESIQSENDFAQLTDDEKAELEFLHDIADETHRNFTDTQKQYLQFLDSQKNTDRPTRAKDLIDNTKNEVKTLTVDDRQDTISQNEIQKNKTVSERPTIPTKVSFDYSKIEILKQELDTIKDLLYHSQTQNEIDSHRQNFIDKMNEIKNAFGSDNTDKYKAFRVGYAKWYLKVMDILKLRMIEKRQNTIVGDTDSQPSKKPIQEVEFLTSDENNRYSELMTQFTQSTDDTIKNNFDGIKSFFQSLKGNHSDEFIDYKVNYFLSILPRYRSYFSVIDNFFKSHDCAILS